MYVFVLKECGSDPIIKLFIVLVYVFVLKECGSDPIIKLFIAQNCTRQLPFSVRFPNARGLRTCSKPDQSPPTWTFMSHMTMVMSWCGMLSTRSFGVIVVVGWCIALTNGDLGIMVTLACDVTNIVVINGSFTGVHSVSALFASLSRMTATPP